MLRSRPWFEELESRAVPTVAISSLGPMVEGNPTNAPLVVNGSGFTSSSIVQWNGVALIITSSSPNQLQAQVPASVVSDVGTAMITVVDPSGTSNTVTLSITDAPLTLTLASNLSFVTGANNNVLLGSFTDADPSPNIANYQAVIQWGDGGVSNASAVAGTIVANGSGGFNILGSHYYPSAAAGLPFSIQVSDLGPTTTAFTATQVMSGGVSGGAYQLGTHTLTKVIDVAHLLNTVGNNGLYYPSVSGAITSLTSSFAFQVFSGPASSAEVGVGLLIKQGNSYYVSGYHSVPQNGWMNIGTAQTPSSYMLLTAGTGPAMPDFSASGAPMEFGFLTANSTGGGLETLTWGMDNFTVTINGTTYSDSTFNSANWTHLAVYQDNLGAATASQNTSVNVNSQPLALTLANLNFVAGSNNNVLLGSFTDPNSTANIKNYLAVIQWGDGSVSNATADNGGIAANGQGGFNIIGSHYYNNEVQQSVAKSGFTFSIQVQDMNAADAAYSASLQNLGVTTAPFSTTQMTSGGPNGGNYLQGTQTLLRGITVGHLTNLTGPNGLYSPSLSGAITSLTFSLDFEVLSGPTSSAQVGVGLLLKQGNNYYMSGYQSVPQNGWNIWTTQTAYSTAQTASTFKLIAGKGSTTPNFSAIGSQSGAPIQFGFVTANSGGGSLKSLTWGIAAFTITINGTTYSDNTFSDANWADIPIYQDNFGTASASQSMSINIADAPLNLTLAPNLNFSVGQNQNVVVGSFTYGNSAATANSFQAVINWGDGIVSSATAANGGIVPNGQGGFNIIGSHKYTQGGIGLPFSVKVNDWSAADIAYSATQMLTGGPTGGAFRQENMTLINETDVAHLFNLPGNTNMNGTYYPSVSGPITSLTFSDNFIIYPAATGSSDQVGMGFLVKQGNVYYVADYQSYSQNGWNSVTTPALTALDFRPVAGMGPNTPAHPDFSATGAPLQFGYFTAHSCNALQSYVTGLANFAITINGTTYQDTTASNGNWTDVVTRQDVLPASSASQSASINVT